MRKAAKTVQTRSILHDGKVVPPTGIELIVADHCNIACRQCNHGSPVMRKWNADPQDIARDLGRLASHYRPAFVKYIGGEPLLHPDLAAILRAGRASGISGHHLLVTNGTLLDRMPEEVWGLIDELEVSVYPETGVDEARLAPIRQKAQSHGTRVTVNHFPFFRRTFTRVRTEDDALVNNVFRACKAANVWGCHTLYKGTLYRCPQSAYALTLAGVDGSDGFVLDDAAGLTDRLLAFLNDPQPLLSCRYCVGTAGRKQDHRLLTRAGWAEDLSEPAETMLDRALLAENLAEVVTLDDCKTPGNHLHRGPWKRLLAQLGIRSTRMRHARSPRQDG
jgi:organic radical activating enzyme